MLRKSEIALYKIYEVLEDNERFRNNTNLCDLFDIPISFPGKICGHCDLCYDWIKKNYDKIEIVID